jgi:hypothetical protein
MQCMLLKSIQKGGLKIYCRTLLGLPCNFNMDSILDDMSINIKLLGYNDDVMICIEMPVLRIIR